MLKTKNIDTKKLGLITGLLGVFSIIIVVAVCYLSYKQQCIDDSLGWCGFGVFLSGIYSSLFGITLIAISIIKEISERRYFKKYGKYTKTCLGKLFKYIFIAILIVAIPISFTFDSDLSITIGVFAALMLSFVIFSSIVQIWRKKM